MAKRKVISVFALSVSMGALSIGAATPAFAQEDPQTEDSIASQEAIIVTGTRRTDRTVADSPVPVDVISGEELLNSGTTETNKLLNQLVSSA